MGKILVIRGGALGDFLLTLPAISLLRKALPDAQVDVLGYQQFIQVAQAAGLVDGARSIEYGKLAPFFAKQVDLAPELREYFGSFDVVISYLFDPDALFTTNLARCEVETILRGKHKPAEGEGHAALQLAKPLEALAVYTEDRPRLKLGIAPDQVAPGPGGTLALAPGSGSLAKNWPAERWIDLGHRALDEGKADQLLLLTGEVESASGLRDLVLSGLDGLPLLHLDHAPLTVVAEALISCSAYVGNDSGLSHLAGGLGIPTTAIFGPTDPDVWSPVGDQVAVVQALDGGDLAEVELKDVADSIPAPN